ncbi:MAG: hypothetical protein CR979_01770 [Propionibacterium sp.]|nr:MAG: hypothetical protein CR979_01770 [Propionibacterium sp.]
MGRLGRFLAVLLITAGIFLLTNNQFASAGNPDWAITRYNVVADLSDDGVAEVELTLDFDFGDNPGHGPFIVLPVRQRVEDPKKWLELGVDLVSVTSPTGADTTILQRDENNTRVIRVGDEDLTFTGVQTYVIKYQLTGLVAQKNKVSGLDEFNWNAIGPAWQVPISNIDVTVNGPVPVTKAACFTGENYTKDCKFNQDGKTVHYKVKALAGETPMQVVAGFPPGTFVGVTQRFSKRMTLEDMFELNPATGIATGATLLGGALLIRRKNKRHAQDDAYLNLPPGMIPVAGQKAVIGKWQGPKPVVVQFTPPRGVRPGEIGTLLDAKVDNVDITASIIDLAVRGYIHIEPNATGKAHTFYPTAKPLGNLTQYERRLYDKLFYNYGPVSTDDMDDGNYTSLSSETRELLDRRVVEVGWFKTSPKNERFKFYAVATALIITGAIATFHGVAFGWGIFGLALIVLGLGLAFSVRKYGSRTALGSAVLAQTKGFEQYLLTAEADQIRFEEGIDVFSRYLPYAIIFGVTDRWVKIFKQLEQANIYYADLSWYGSQSFHNFRSAYFVNSMTGMTDSISAAIRSSESSSSGGGSGFSGGGGFGGGGGGGW